jgi:hypothetical protein
MEIYFSLEKEENSDVCYRMDEPWGYYSNWNKSATGKYCMIPIMWCTWEYSKSQKQKLEWWPLGPEEVGEVNI